MITEREFAMRLYNTIVSQYPNVHQFCLANEWKHAQLYNWLNGGMFPSAPNLIKLSNQLNVSIDYLLDNEMRLQNGEGGKIMHKFKKLVSKKVDSKNYYSILYFDKTDGEIHQGFSSGSLDVISDFLKEFFINNNTERHAHWNDNFSFKSNAKRVDICSCCKSAINRDIDSDKYNYCPTCGARMDEVKEKE